jgi:hypothetical protein
MRYNKVRPIPSHRTPWSPSRRDVLRYGAAALAATAIAPLWTRRAAAQSVAFDYYISTTGSDGNPGTLASPWALSSLLSSSPNQSKMAGKAIGVIAGTYNVMTLLGISTYPGNEVMPTLLVVPGGASGSPTHLASCNSSGVYAPVGNASGQWAIINGQGTAANNSGGQTLLGSFGSNGGYITIDGLEVTGAYYHAIAAGYNIGGTFDGNRVAGVTIQNNYIHGVTNQIAQENPTGVTLYTCTGALVQNNYITNITDNSSRATCIETWNTDNTTIQFNTNIGSASQPGGIFIKNQGNYQNTVRYNYVDLTAAGGASNGVGGLNADLWGSASNTSSWYGNVVIADNPVWSNVIGSSPFPNTPERQLWYNNTFVGIPGAGDSIICRCGSPGTITFYNNICYSTSSNYGQLVTNVSALALSDYNLFNVLKLGLMPDGGGKIESAATQSYTSIASWAAALNSAVAGKDAHSISTAPTFVGGSPTLPALYYQLASGSAGKNAGSTNGQTSGSATDMGAWGNGASQIGASFAPGVSIAVPAAPVLSLS